MGWTLSSASLSENLVSVLPSLLMIATGPLRFGHPQPKVYTGNVTAIVPQPACMQANGSLIGSYGVSEDCLSLSIIGPEKVAGTKSKLPVMVWM